ncbi:MAG: hypothetical protein BVN35_04100 [Proteobacteria bacterium ST_bin11]|jgi:hypothetical protein|nr:MAG: hypothetical protein BVN35_04100 [Proteobacteria bacterium ST_bin11]
MTPEHVQQWVNNHPLTPIHVDCAVTVMLKIIDGKCKMRPTEKVVMTILYDCVKHLPGQILQADLHPLIETARANEDDEALKNLIYEKRMMAETAISRPVMKAFKAMIREQGLLERREEKETEE